MVHRAGERWLCASAQHTYLDDGLYPVTLTVTDPDVIKQKYPKGFEAPRPYLRMTPQPNK